YHNLHQFPSNFKTLLHLHMIFSCIICTRELEDLHITKSDSIPTAFIDSLSSIHVFLPANQQKQKIPLRLGKGIGSTTLSVYL
ncbi:MAG: hypothetical protein J6C02_05920, partial [Peptococcaceae bacterium]|nr:hypothetical protein [Peptococcaceae bacterium]